MSLHVIVLSLNHIAEVIFSTICFYPLLFSHIQLRMAKNVIRDSTRHKRLLALNWYFENTTPVVRNKHLIWIHFLAKL